MTELERAEARIKTLRTLLNRWVGVIENCSVTAGVCCCGDSMDEHSHPMSCGHTPVDMGAYHAGLLMEETRFVLGETPNDTGR
jgi:hypothetical protein